MPSQFVKEFDTPAFKGKVTVNTGVFINNEWRDGSDNTTIDLINPTNGQVYTKVSEATAKDVDIAVEAAQKAFDTTWGFKTPGLMRGELMYKLAFAMEEIQDELSALEVLDNGKTFKDAKTIDVSAAIACIKYYAGWADKNSGQQMETHEGKFAYTRHEPIGVVGQIIPWNFPLLMWSWKVGPALATGNTIVMKPSELTPLSALRCCDLIKQVGFPPGVFNLVTGYGQTVGNAISMHMKIDKVAFTGSTLVGRKIMESAAKSNLKKVTLELGGKSPNIIFNDADIDMAVGWASHGIYWNHGQACCAGSRIFVQEGIYDKFLAAFAKKAQSIQIGDPFGSETEQGPQVSEMQYDRIMEYITSGKEEGATVHTGGERHGSEGYFIKPTIFTDTHPDMRIVKEEIFGPVGVVIKFKDAADMVKQANDTVYGLAAAIFTKDLNTAIETGHALKAGTVWINCINNINPSVPFGGYKQSGIGRELGQYALANYTNVKAVHVNLGIPI